MKEMLNWVANGCGLVGMLACLVAGVVRMTGGYNIAGLEAGTLFLLGIGLMLVGCLIILQRLLVLLEKR